MIKRTIRFDAMLILLMIVVTYSIAPIVSRAFSAFLTTYAYLLLIILVLALVILGRRKHSLNEYVSVLLPFVFFQLLTYLTKADSLLVWGYKVLLFLLPIALGYYVSYEKKEYIPGLFKIVLFALAITIITTIVGLVRYPFAARILATISSSQDDAVVLYDWNNIGGYSFVYMLVLLYPLIILAYKQRRLPLFWAAICAISIGVVIIMSEYTTAFLLFLLSSILFLLKRQMSTRNMFVFSIVGVVAAILFSDVFSDLLEYLASVMSSPVFKERLTALAGGTTGLEASESNRIFLYRQSFSTFLSHPIFGTMLSGGGGTGGHSQILDALGTYGLVGGALLVWMYRYVYVLFFKPYRQQDGFGYIIWFLMQTLFLSIVNTGFWLDVLTLFGPLFLYVIYHKKEE